MYSDPQNIYTQKGKKKKKNQFRDTFYFLKANLFTENSVTFFMPSLGTAQPVCQT